MEKDTKQNKPNKQVTNKSNRIDKNSSYRNYTYDDNQQFSYKNRKHFLFVVGKKKVFFPLLLLFLCIDRSFCHAICARARARSLPLSKITHCCWVRKTILEWNLREFASFMAHIMNNKCNKFIILRERVKMPFLWLRVCQYFVRFCFYSVFVFGSPSSSFLLWCMGGAPHQRRFIKLFCLMIERTYFQQCT